MLLLLLRINAVLVNACKALFEYVAMSPETYLYHNSELGIA